MDHCRVCGVEHATGSCPGCLTEVRDGFGDLRRMYDGLFEEAVTRGVEGEAMNLLGPAADPEARGHWEASVLAGRIVPVDCDAREFDDVKAWLETASHELHPLIVIGGWAIVYRDAFEHDEPIGRINVLTEVGYLDRNLSHMADLADVPFEDFARDLRRCVAHMERVLHDGEQVDRTRVTCVNEECRKRPRLERIHGIAVHQDRWRCPSCGKVYDDGDYRDAHARQLKHKGAEKFLPLREAVSTLVAQGRSERTIRKWMAPPTPANPEQMEAVVGGFCEIRSHRVWVWWPDLWVLHLTTKTRNRAA
jgi:hypothetical protein